MSEQLIEKEFINRAECPPYFDVEQEFFIIDSDNLRDVKTKLYGYSVQDSGIYDNENLTETSAAALNGCGVYVYICVVGGVLQYSRILMAAMEFIYSKKTTILR